MLKGLHADNGELNRRSFGPHISIKEYFSSIRTVDCQDHSILYLENPENKVSK